MMAPLILRTGEHLQHRGSIGSIGSTAAASGSITQLAEVYVPAVDGLG